MRKPKWDTELGKLLWLEGKGDGEIADELHIPTSSVTSYRRRHWEKQLIRKEDAPPGPSDDAAEETEEERKAEGGAAVMKAAPAGIEIQETVIKNEENVMNKEQTTAASEGGQGKKPLEVYDVLEAATADMRGIQAICTADAIMCLWNWGGKEDLLKARSSIDYLLRRLGE